MESKYFEKKKKDTTKSVVLLAKARTCWMGENSSCLHSKSRAITDSAFVPHNQFGAEEISP